MRTIRKCDHGCGDVPCGASAWAGLVTSWVHAPEVLILLKCFSIRCRHLYPSPSPRATATCLTKGVGQDSGPRHPWAGIAVFQRRRCRHLATVLGLIPHSRLGRARAAGDRRGAALTAWVARGAPLALPWRTRRMTRPSIPEQGSRQQTAGSNSPDWAGTAMGLESQAVAPAKISKPVSMLVLVDGRSGMRRIASIAFCPIKKRFDRTVDKGCGSSRPISSPLKPKIAS